MATFPVPDFVQNRNHYRAASPVRRGWPVKLGPSDTLVEECDAASDRPIGIAVTDYGPGDVVEIVWIGWAGIAVQAAQGDEIRLGSAGAPVVGGTGTMLGIAGGGAVGAYTITRLGLLGYQPSEGGGGGGAYSGWLIVEVEEGHEYHIAPEDFGKNILVAFEDPNVSAADAVVYAPATAAGVPLMDAAVGASVTFAVYISEDDGSGVAPARLQTFYSEDPDTDPEVLVVEWGRASGYTLTRMEGFNDVPGVLLVATPLAVLDLFDADLSIAPYRVIPSGGEGPSEFTLDESNGIDLVDTSIEITWDVETIRLPRNLPTEMNELPHGTTFTRQVVKQSGYDSPSEIRAFMDQHVGSSTLIPGAVVVAPFSLPGQIHTLTFQRYSGPYPGAYLGDFNGWIVTVQTTGHQSVEAEDVEYAPAESGDWDVQQNYVKGALDELAARVKALEGA